jgi:Endodeoxyribonuclease RusA
MNNYEQEKGVSLDRPPRADQQIQVHDWLQALRGGDNFPIYSAQADLTRATLHLSLSEKAWRIAQCACTSCEVIVSLDGKIGLYKIFPIDVEPWSRQSSKDATQIRDAVRNELAERGMLQPWTESPLCLTIVSLVPSTTRRKDVDNLVKGLLDSMQDVLYRDDRLVQCLTSRRVEYAGPVGHYIVAARAVYPWNADVVHDNPAAPQIRSGKRVSS